MKRIITIAIIVGIVALIAFKLYSNKQKIVAEQTPAKVIHDEIAVTTTLVTEREASHSFSAVGTLKGAHEARILAQTAGRILRLNAELGMHVSKGQLIAVTDNNLQELAVATANNNLAKAEADLARYKQLYEGGAATEQKYTEVQTTWKNAVTAVEQSKKQFSDANVKAPFSGIIISKDVEEGSYVNVGNPIASLIDISSLKVLVSVPENQVYGLSVGQEVSLTADVTPGQVYKGKITYITPKGDDSHNYPVEILLDNSGSVLKAGTFVTVTFKTNQTGKVKVIPRKTLVSGSSDGKIFVIENNKAHLRKINILREAGDSLEVSAGLNLGETVVTTGQLNLVEGSKVNVIQ